MPHLRRPSIHAKDQRVAIDCEHNVLETTVTAEFQTHHSFSFGHTGIQPPFLSHDKEVPDKALMFYT